MQPREKYSFQLNLRLSFNQSYLLWVFRLMDILDTKLGQPM